MVYLLKTRSRKTHEFAELVKVQLYLNLINFMKRMSIYCCIYVILHVSCIMIFILYTCIIYPANGLQNSSAQKCQIFAPNGGWTAHISHIKNHHKDFETVVRQHSDNIKNNAVMTTFFQKDLDPKAKGYYAWMKLIVEKNLPFDTVTDLLVMRDIAAPYMYYRHRMQWKDSTVLVS